MTNPWNQNSLFGNSYHLRMVYDPQYGWVQPAYTILPLQPSPQQGIYDYHNQISYAHHNQLSNIKCGSLEHSPSNFNYYHLCGGSVDNSNSYISKVVGKRNMQPPVANDANYNPYGSSCYDSTVYGYGTTANDVGYGEFGGHVNTRTYGKPLRLGTEYIPPGTQMSLRSNQVSSGYVSTMYGANTRYEGVVLGNVHGSEGPFPCHTGQPAGNAAGYRNQRYGRSEGHFGYQSGYGAFGAHVFGAISGSSTGFGAQSSGSGYIDSSGITGYSNAWRSVISQGGNYGAFQSTLYHGGIGFSAKESFINDLPTLTQGTQECFGLSKSSKQAHISGNVNELIETNEVVEKSLPIENVHILEIDKMVDKGEECIENFKIEKNLVQEVENVIYKDSSFVIEEVRESQSLYSDSNSLENITDLGQSAIYVHDILEGETLHPSFTNDLHQFVAIKNDEENRKNFKKKGYRMTRLEAVLKVEMDESMSEHVGHLIEFKAEKDKSKGVQFGHLDTNENFVINPLKKRKPSSSTHEEKLYTQQEVIKSRGRCLVELDSYYTSHYDLQDFLTSQKKPKNDKNIRLGVGAEDSRHFRMPDEAIHFIRGGTVNSNDCLKFSPPPNFFYRRSKDLQDLDWS